MEFNFFSMASFKRKSKSRASYDEKRDGWTGSDAELEKKEMPSTTIYSILIEKVKEGGWWEHNGIRDGDELLSVMDEHTGKETNIYRLDK